MSSLQTMVTMVTVTKAAQGITTRTTMAVKQMWTREAMSHPMQTPRVVVGAVIEVVVGPADRARVDGYPVVAAERVRMYRRPVVPVERALKNRAKDKEGHIEYLGPRYRSDTS